MEEKSYWCAACGEVRKLRTLVFAALICALSIVVGAFYVVVGDSLRVYFTFFITAVGCAVYGPLLGLLVGAVTDTLNYMLFPSGAYFPGYLLSEMLAGLVYGLFLYRKKITVLRLFSAKLIVNYVINVGLGSLWNQILYGKGYLYYMVKSMIKNSLLLPVEVILLAALFAVLVPTFSQFGLLPRHRQDELEKLSLSSSAFTVLGLDCLFAGGCSFYYAVQNAVPIFLTIAVLLAGMGVALLILGPVLRHRRQISHDE